MVYKHSQLYPQTTRTTVRVLAAVSNSLPKSSEKQNYKVALGSVITLFCLTQNYQEKC